MRFERWITKAKDTHSEYVMIIASAPQQLSHEGSSLLCDTYVTCLVILY